MASSSQEGGQETQEGFLCKAWKDAPEGHLSPYQQMKACVLFDVLKEISEQIPHGLRDGKPNCQWIAG